MRYSAPFISNSNYGTSRSELPATRQAGFRNPLFSDLFSCLPQLRGWGTVSQPVRCRKGNAIYLNEKGRQPKLPAGTHIYFRKLRTR